MAILNSYVKIPEGIYIEIHLLSFGGLPCWKTPQVRPLKTVQALGRIGDQFGHSLRNRSATIAKTTTFTYVRTGHIFTL